METDKINDKEFIVKLILAEKKGLTLRETAEQLGVSHEWVRNIFFKETGRPWGQSRKASLLSNEAIIISQEVERALKERDLKKLCKAVDGVQLYANRRSWLVAQLAYAFSVVQPYGGMVTLSRLNGMEAGTLRHYARVYRKYGKMAKSYPFISFSFFATMANYKLTEAQARELIELAKEEGMGVGQFATAIKDMLYPLDKDKKTAIIKPVRIKRWKKH